MLKFLANFFLQVVRCRFRLDTLCHHVSMHWVNKNTWAKFILLVTLVYSSLGATVATNVFSVHSNWNHLKNIAFSKAPKKPSQIFFFKKCIPDFSSKRTTDPIYAKKWEGKVDWAFVCQGESLEYRSLWVSELGSQALNINTWGHCELQLSFQGSQYHINRWAFRA